ncbi:hypothetical protein LCGC14_1326770 [marine sediment metagenome]|uniref:Uncharacterized protein n=1 Tax=marine sediment metagenome TaxID=412755 RepID=A0A0F9KIE1_9ZZZZ
MAKARIISNVRVDAFTCDGVTFTKGWTTVADKAVDGLLRCEYKGSPVFEIEMPPVVVDKTSTDFFITDDEDHDTEDESDGTE